MNIFGAKTKQTLLSITLVILSFGLLVLACVIGSVAVNFGDLLRTLTGQASDPTAQMVVLGIRLPRALLAYAVGGTLAVCGASLQGVFKNPMADSHILGVSSGSALGAAICIVAGLQMTVLGLGALTLCAFLGGLLAVFAVYALARVRGRVTPVGMLLAGIALGSVMTALVSGLMLFNRERLEQIFLWTLGSFSAPAWEKVFLAIPVMLIGVRVCFAYRKPLNLLQLGDAGAQSLGVDVSKVRRNIMISTALSTAAAVSVCGIIGFVGLMVPHGVRMLAGPDYRKLLPLSFLTGGSFLLLMDTLARTVISPLEINVGILTAILGGPFFLFLLRRKGLQ